MCQSSNVRHVKDYLQLHEFHGFTQYSSGAVHKLAQLDPNHQTNNKKDKFSIFDSLDLNQVKQLFDKKTRKYFIKKASSKWLTNKIIQPLTFLPSALHNQYTNAAKCGNVVQLDGGQMKIFRCKTRFCVECNRIRTGKLINRYLPIIEKWEEKQFLTLTIPNVSGQDLSGGLDEMQKTLSLIQRKWKRKRKEGGEKLSSMQDIYGNLEMLKKIEITYNFRLNNYHPHFHIITKDYISAEFILNEWLNYWPDATKKAQDIRPADNGTAKELFKYFTKFWKFDHKNKKIELYSPGVLDQIFLSLQRRRIVQTVGFKVSDYTNYSDDYIYEVTMKAAEMIRERYEHFTDENKQNWREKIMLKTGYYVWDYKRSEWFCKITGDKLSHYKAPESVKGWFIQNLTEADHYQLLDYSPENNYVNLLQEYEWKGQSNAAVRINENKWSRTFNLSKETESEKRLSRLLANDGKLIDYIAERAEREKERREYEQLKQKIEGISKLLETKRPINGANKQGQQRIRFN